MIKRFLSLVLCLCMMCTATVALAAGEVKYPTNQTGNFDTAYGVDITAIATSTADEASDPVYSVEIVWGDMAFAWGYDDNKTTATWDPETHTYTYTAKEVQGGTDQQGWYMVTDTALTHSGAVELGLTTQDAVLVFNHSNRAVKAEIAIENVTDGDTNDLTAAFTKTSISTNLSTTGDVHTLTAGTENDIFADDGSSVMGTVAITNDMTTFADYASATPIAKLNVTISKAE